MLRFMLRGGMLLCVVCITMVMGIKALGSFVPDGTRLVFFVEADTGTSSLYVTALSRNLTVRFASDVYGTMISFSPDGDYVFYTLELEIFSINSDGDHLRRLSPAGMQAFNPVWSPDGTKIAFVTTEGSSTVGQLGIIDLERDGQTID